jgi:hypothetical protein
MYYEFQIEQNWKLLMLQLENLSQDIATMPQLLQIQY